MSGLKKTVTFYGPHPGFQGAAISLPKIVKEKIDGLDGKEIKLSDATAMLSKVARSVNGVLRHDRKGKCIFLIINPKSLPRHIFRLIRYK